MRHLDLHNKILGDVDDKCPIIKNTIMVLAKRFIIQASNVEDLRLHRFKNRMNIILRWRG